MAREVIGKNKGKPDMNMYIADTYEKLSRKAADDLVQLLRSIPSPLICPASGDSPTGLYKELVSLAGDEHLDCSRWHFVGLDEWVGMNGTDEGSCRFHLDRQLFRPLQVREEQICFFNGRAADLQVECDLTETFIRKQGGIDVAILGIGLNGHIGMNEPGTPSSARSHVTAIDPLTQQVGQKYFQQKVGLTQGITLGLATLMEARHLMLLVSGVHKTGIVKRMLQEDVSEALPATLLRRHPDLNIYLDVAAAQELET